MGVLLHQPKGRPRKQFRDQRIINENQGHLVVAAHNTNPTLVCDLVINIKDCSQKDMEILCCWENHFFDVNAPFITTLNETTKKYTIWKIRKGGAV